MQVPQNSQLQKKAVIIVADGSEDMELVITYDCLKRANIATEIASVDKCDFIVCASGTKIIPSFWISDLKEQDFDAVIITGGFKGVENVSNSEIAKQLIISQMEKKKLVAAICAAPTFLSKIGVLNGRKATCYPSLSADLQNSTYINERVVVDGNVITSQGPATSFDFSLAIIKFLLGKEVMEKISSGILYT